MKTKFSRPNILYLLILLLLVLLPCGKCEISQQEEDVYVCGPEKMFLLDPRIAVVVAGTQLLIEQGHENMALGYRYTLQMPPPLYFSGFAECYIAGSGPLDEDKVNRCIVCLEIARLECTGIYCERRTSARCQRSECRLDYSIVPEDEDSCKVAP